MRSTILSGIPEDTWRRVMTPELEQELYSLGEVIPCPRPRELTEDAYGDLWAQADAVLSGWGVRPPTPAILDRAERLRIICHSAGSLRMFPRYALEKGIVITTARAAIARTVAEFSLLNALLLLRRHAAYVDSSEARRSFLSPSGGNPFNETLYGKTVGLVGLGSVGRHFRGLLGPFGCRVLVYDPYLSAEEARAQNVETVSLDELLRSSKVVSLHAPDIPETHGMIGARELALLQDGTIFLNSARGRIVDTEALTRELTTGRFSAAIDVTDPEPLPADHPLRALPNVIFTPHVAGPTTDELPELARTAIRDLGRYLRGEKPLYAVTLEEYDRMSF